jgi:hypothetical protein
MISSGSDQLGLLQQSPSCDFPLLLRQDESMNGPVIHDAFFLVTAAFDPSALSAASFTPVRAILGCISLVAARALEKSAGIGVCLGPGKAVEHAVPFAARTLTSSLIAIRLDEEASTFQVVTLHPSIMRLC